MNDSAPIFIVSSPRSGSTLLRLLLSAHSRIAIPPPGFMFPLIYPFLHTYGDLSRTTNLDLLIEDVLEFQENKPWPMPLSVERVRTAMTEPGFCGVYKALKRIWCDHHNKPRWGEKTPRNIYFMAEILECFPSAQFLHICRDGRDVAIDWMENLNWPKNVYHTALHWQESMRAIRPFRKKLNPAQLFEVKYEVLVRRPEDTLKEVCAFLQEEYEPTMFDFYRQEETIRWSESAFCHRFLKNPINDNHVGLYQERLSPADRGMLAGLIGEELKELGYPVEEKPRQVTPEELRNYNEDARANEVGTIKFKMRHWEKRRQRRELGIWNDEGLTKAFG
jgi:hypothetical protein